MTSQEQLSAAHSHGDAVNAELAVARGGWEDREKHLMEQCTCAEKRADDMAQQNTLLYEQAETVCGVWMCGNYYVRLV